MRGIIGRKSKAAPNKGESTTVWQEPREGGKGGIREMREENGDGRGFKTKKKTSTEAEQGSPLWVL